MLNILLIYDYRFLWVEFQLKAICTQVSDHGIEETLQNMPKDMDTTYERILDIIDKKPSSQRELARKALLFIAYARKPVSIDILALAIATKDYNQRLDMLRSSISTEKIILNACGNLLSIDNTNSDFRQVCSMNVSYMSFLLISVYNRCILCTFQYKSFLLVTGPNSFIPFL